MSSDGPKDPILKVMSLAMRMMSLPAGNSGVLRMTFQATIPIWNVENLTVKQFKQKVQRKYNQQPHTSHSYITIKNRHHYTLGKAIPWMLHLRQQTLPGVDNNSSSYLLVNV